LVGFPVVFERRYELMRGQGKLMQKSTPQVSKYWGPEQFCSFADVEWWCVDEAMLVYTAVVAIVGLYTLNCFGHLFVLLVVAGLLLPENTDSQMFDYNMVAEID
jgi:hypothetical protein